jgi:hypothetical protein
MPLDVTNYPITEVIRLLKESGGNKEGSINGDLGTIYLEEFRDKNGYVGYKIFFRFQHECLENGIFVYRKSTKLIAHIVKNPSHSIKPINLGFRIKFAEAH